MKTLLHMVKKIGRFAYPLYFYPNQLRALMLKRVKANSSERYFFEKPYSRYAQA